MSVYVYEFIEDIFEIITVYIVICMISRHNRLKNHLLEVVMVLSISGWTVFLSWNNIPYASLFSMAALILFICIFSQNRKMHAFITSGIANFIFFLMELLGAFVGSIAWGNHFQEDPRKVLFVLGVLLVGTIIMYFFSMHRLQIGDMVTTRFGLLPLIVVNLILFVCIIANIWNRDTLQFLMDFKEMIVLSLSFLTATIILFFIVLKYEDEKKQNEMITEYNEALCLVTNNLQKREHEFKNELNTLLSLIEKPGEYTNTMIKRYIKELYEEEISQSRYAVIADNATISYLLLRYQNIANQKDISLAINSRTPFPHYPLREKELLEIVSNLMNNAIEATIALPVSERYILAEFLDNEIAIQNTFSEEKTQITIDQMRQGGFSSKNLGRGYGVSNVLDILERNRIQYSISKEKNNFSFVLLF